MPEPGASPVPLPEPDRVAVLGVLRLAMRVGEVMVANAESAADCRSALERVTRALGVPGVTVVVEMDTVTLSWLPPEGHGEPVTLVREVEGADPHLHRLVAAEKLVGRIVAGEVGLVRAAKELDAIAVAPDPYPAWVVVGAGLASVAGWTLFAGGDLIAVAVAVATTAVVWPLMGLVRRSRLPEVFQLAAAAFAVAALPYLAAWAGLTFVVVAAVVGGLYQLLPGRLLVASVADGLAGSPLSALARGLQAVVIAVGVALGVLGALRLMDALGVAPPEAQGPGFPWWATMLAAGVAVVGLAVARQIPVATIVPVGALAMVVWIVGRGTAPEAWRQEAAAGLGALVLGFGGQVLARAQHTVPVLYTGTAVLVLVPGTVLYAAMFSFASGDPSRGGEFTALAVTISVAIAAGTTLGVALGRILGQVPRAVGLLPTTGGPPAS